MKEYILVLTTTPTKGEGEKIGNILIKEKKAACVSIIPCVSSIFPWEGKIEREEEAQLLIKTKKGLLEDVISIIKDNHSYNVPEIIALPILGGNKAYLEWIDKSL